MVCSNLLFNVTFGDILVICMYVTAQMSRRTARERWPSIGLHLLDLYNILNLKLGIFDKNNLQITQPITDFKENSAYETTKTAAP